MEILLLWFNMIIRVGDYLNLSFNSDTEIVVDYVFNLEGELK